MAHSREIIASLTGWRGVLALIVVASHVNALPQNCLFLVLSAMTIFFMLSGFSLQYNNAWGSTVQGGAYRRFVGRRLLRIYPLHLATLVLVLLTSGWNPGWPALTNALLLQSWVPDTQHYFGFNGESWFLSSLFFCYLFFPLLSALLRRRHGPLWLLAVAVALLAAGWLLASTQAGGVRFWFYIFPPSRLAEFAVGMLLGHYARSRGTLAARWPGAAELGAVLLWMAAGAVYFANRNFIIHNAMCSWWIVPGAVLIMSYWSARRNPGLLGRLLSAPVMQFLGRHSFEIYMWQYLVMVGAPKLLAALVPGLPQWLVLPCSFAMLLLVAYAWRQAQRRLLGR